MQQAQALQTQTCPLTTVWHIQIFVDVTDHESKVVSLLERRTENLQGNSCSRCFLFIIVHWNRWGYKEKCFYSLFRIHLKQSHAVGLSRWPLAGRTEGLSGYLYVFSSQTGSSTSQVHLDMSSCPSCILLMALSPINKACIWMLSVCLARSFTPPCFTICMRILACLQSCSMNNEWKGIRKTYSSYTSTSSDTSKQHDLGGGRSVSEIRARCQTLPHNWDQELASQPSVPSNIL